MPGNMRLTGNKEINVDSYRNGKTLALYKTVIDSTVRAQKCREGVKAGLHWMIDHLRTTEL